MYRKFIATILRSPEEGADTAVWLSTLPEGGPSGGFFRDRRPVHCPDRNGRRPRFCRKP